MASAADRDPRHHEEKMQKVLADVREDIDKVDEPRFKAMFETSAEVPGGLIKAFDDYGKNTEAAWRGWQRVIANRDSSGSCRARPRNTD